MSNTNKSRILEEVQSIIQYPVKDESLLWEAFQAAGSVFDINGNYTPPDGNKRLAVVGDAVLKVALMEDWYHGGTVKERADQICQEVATNINLDRIGKSLGLDKYVNRLGTGNSFAVPWRTMAATMEAILGAVYFDGGMDAVKLVMRNIGLVPA